jgi:hypothetical protein
MRNERHEPKSPERTVPPLEMMESGELCWHALCT